MRVDPLMLATFLGMLAVTYGARIGGYLLVRRRPIDGRVKGVLDAVPVAVLAAIIAPAVFATGPAESLAALATLLLAWRLPMLVAVVGGVAAVVLLRSLLG
jgi:branched chain amino acid efflux pump